MSGEAMRPNISLPQVLLGQLAMGASLGMFLAFFLIASDAANIYQMIVHSSAPKTTVLIVVGSFMAMFGIGAALTGLVFTLIEDEER